VVAEVDGDFGAVLPAHLGEWHASLPSIVRPAQPH
jgi:hypothetical protein